MRRACVIKKCAMQKMVHPLEALPSEADALLYEDDELDTNACMLPLVRFIEKASSLYSPGDCTP